MPETAPPQGFSSQFGQNRPVTITANHVDNTGTVVPNHGASIPDSEAIGPDSQPLSAWQKANNIDVSKQIKLVKLAHMRYQHPELDQITRFLQDFGMHVVRRTPDRAWFRGYGPDQYVYYAERGPERKFLGGTFTVESRAELDKAARLPGAGPITSLADAPGGGALVTLHDPEGFPINLMFGQQEDDDDSSAALPDVFPRPSKVLLNDERDKPRVRKFNRFTPGPAAVHKLGHFGLCVTRFAEQVEWYTRTFNLAPTDFMYVSVDGDGGEAGSSEKTTTTTTKKNKDVAVFAHIDRGDEPVDHHTFFMSTNPTAHVHHASFEVHDYDTQQLGHQWLGKQGYTSVWGVGRHILGSQIFDYWWDTSGNMIEHYTDGDLVNQDTPIGWGMAGDEGLAVWGPEVPSWFLN